ncbi:Eco57I restriction-modification methylase domain-containing protein [Staphylococcus sp. NRL 16/872]|uniref:Eco57I restriction-modification methylase domain-containing protein n=1 Tax=Staphylococcus sp. NRL 16/872 TaxID=2930131 RepID=UPI001FB25DE8|nr:MULTISPECIES: methyltransferase [unclassified Staphylococcus]MCJ1655599.1 Eco57I restriction-modification methylase domain-containing protein [Staphylococcus sp. NRL 21/187]MCJ1667324.1 Eco57I restriction-modification methylase domain-containing protein [Staphylococcus sp. NRL 19/737]WEN69806.1 Eco57I restriction-modification methylase domain-containing protein [Staphylococcus sp. NRL 16/872]
MKNVSQKVKRIINNYNLQSRNKVCDFIKNNPENLKLKDLAKIAELINNKRNDTAAYYSDEELISTMSRCLPDFNKNTLKILEPSVGVGNFLELIINKYKNYDHIIIDVIDVDEDSLKICKILNHYRNLPENIEINYYNEDFLLKEFHNKYDLIIGNPPFLKKGQVKNWDIYQKVLKDYTSKNTAALFLNKSLTLSENIFLIMPKYFLHNNDFSKTRKTSSHYCIKEIIDFGEKGFKGVLIETIAILINTVDKKGITNVYSLTLDKNNKIDQGKMVDEEFPSWLIYRNDFFDKIASDMTFGIFKVFRDRSITNAQLTDNEKNNIRVIKSRNIKKDGSTIMDIKNYDAYITEDNLKEHSVYKYLDRTDVFLSPNMTYYPRVIKKPKGCVTNGSVAILENDSGLLIKNKHLKFWNSEIFTEFYKIARNYSTRSLNIDKNSVFYFGLYNGEKG